jgi:hypothetical protein
MRPWPSSTQFDDDLALGVSDTGIDDANELLHQGVDSEEGLFAILDQAFLDGPEGGILVSSGDEQGRFDLKAAASGSLMVVAL